MVYIDQILKDIAAKNGPEAQMDICEEECAELIQAIIKVKRGCPWGIEKVTEELADVLITAKCLFYTLGPDKVNAVIEKKINRQLDRFAKMHTSDDILESIKDELDKPEEDFDAMMS